MVANTCSAGMARPGSDRVASQTPITSSRSHFSAAAGEMLVVRQRRQPAIAQGRVGHGVVQDSRRAFFPAHLQVQGPVAGVSLKIEGEGKERAVTYIMGSAKKGWYLTSKGTGPLPEGEVEFQVIEAE